MSRQLLGLDTFLVPGPLLPLVQRMSQYTRRELERFKQPDPQLEQLFQASANYAEYRSQYLMRRFGIRAAWEVEQQARGGKSDRGKRGGGGRRGRGDGKGQSGARLSVLFWSVDVVTAQGVSGFVEIPLPVVVPPEFTAKV